MGLSQSPRAATVPFVLGTFGDDLVNKAVFRSRLGGEEIVALGIARNHIKRLPRALRKDAVQLFARAENVVGMDLDIGCLTLHTAERLMDHNLSVGESESLADRKSVV